jgi:hypothetical protein
MLMILDVAPNHITGDFVTDHSHKAALAPEFARPQLPAQMGILARCLPAQTRLPPPSKLRGIRQESSDTAPTSTAVPASKAMTAHETAESKVQETEPTVELTRAVAEPVVPSMSLPSEGSLENWNRSQATGLACSS